MNFTREPIIETVITPRDGCKLVVRSSKGAQSEDYIVDAVEVVSFGHSCFFRSQERPKSFLVPVSDYEVLETKEARMILKNTQSEQPIKIGGGRQPTPEDTIAQEARPAPEQQQQQQNLRNDRKRDRRRRDRRNNNRPDRGPSQPQASGTLEQQQREMHELQAQQDEERNASSSFREPNAANHTEEAPKAPSFISKLFPPPQTLIRETISKYKPVEGAESTEGAPSTDEIFEHNEEDDNEE